MRFSALPSATAHSGRGLARGFLGLIGLLCMPAAALAASGFEIDCNDHAPAAAAVDHSISELDLTVVDLTTPDKVAMDEAPLIVDEEAGNAPVLDLGPRVATLVKDVFGVSELDAEFEAAVESPEVPMAPLAENGDEVAGDEALGQGDIQSDDGLPYSPLRIHREMYRTDI